MSFSTHDKCHVAGLPLRVRARARETRGQTSFSWAAHLAFATTSSRESCAIASACQSHAHTQHTHAKPFDLQQDIMTQRSKERCMHTIVSLCDYFSFHGALLLNALLVSACWVCCRLTCCCFCRCASSWCSRRVDNCFPAPTNTEMRQPGQTIAGTVHKPQCHTDFHSNLSQSLSVLPYSVTSFSRRSTISCLAWTSSCWVTRSLS